jgi:hypothetical protein
MITYAECNEAGKDGAIRLRGGGANLVLLLHNPLAMSPGEDSPIPSSDSSAWWQIFMLQIYLQPAKPRLEAIVWLLIRTPLVRFSWTSSRSERATRTVGPALPGSFFGRYLPLASRGPLGGLSTSSSGTHTPCGLNKAKR